MQQNENDILQARRIFGERVCASGSTFDPIATDQVEDGGEADVGRVVALHHRLYADDLVTPQHL